MMSKAVECCCANIFLSRASFVHSSLDIWNPLDISFILFWLSFCQRKDAFGSSCQNFYRLNLPKEQKCTTLASTQLSRQETPKNSVNK